MPRLKNRNQQIPNGFKFHQPETRKSWPNTPGGMSFDAIVLAVIDHRKGNAYLARKHAWALDYNNVANEVDAFNAQLCQAHGWQDYIMGDSFPKAMPPSSQWRAGAAAAVGSIRKSVAGIKVVADWLGSGLKPVESSVSESRARVCAVRADGKRCPKNQEGDFWQKLDAAAAAQVKSLIEVKNDMDLKTSLDGQLQSCYACDCWLQLKVHTPLAHIKANTSKEVMDQLDPLCWILHET